MPRLQRFYGGDPRFWLDEAPVAIVRAYAAMLPRLEAEEALRGWGLAMLGAGRVSAAAARRKERELMRAAHGRAARPARATPQAMAMMGIAVEIVDG